jgi:hypothetical protein
MPTPRKPGSTTSVVKFSPEVRNRIEAYADKREISLVAAIKMLVARALDDESTPACGGCENRWISITDTDGHRRMTYCPRCHPRRAESAADHTPTVDAVEACAQLNQRLEGDPA